MLLIKVKADMRLLALRNGGTTRSLLDLRFVCNALKIQSSLSLRTLMITARRQVNCHTEISSEFRTHGAMRAYESITRQLAR